MSDPESGSSNAGTPRWVKITGLVILVLVLLVVVSKLAGVDHGPGRHGGESSGAPAGQHTGPPPGVDHEP